MGDLANRSTASHTQLAGIPAVNIASNFSTALRAGRKATDIASEVLAFRTGPGKLTPQEYFYYRLWDGQREWSDKLENIQELVDLAGRFHTARELLDHAALSTSGPQDETADRVRLMTMHKGKGLEFPHVFLPAWEVGTFPTSFGEPAEERRLGYVAITRGMRRVTISHCGFRHGPTSPSLFIDDLPEPHRVRGWLRGQTDLSNATRAGARTTRIDGVQLSNGTGA